jgi:two-component system NtrC family sensor kinase
LRWSSDEAPTDYVVLEVRDTGVGMDKETKEQIFDPGFSTGQDGTGLGLAIVRKVVRDHGGHVEVESEPGVGSAFCIYLPVETGSPHSA